MNCMSNRLRGLVFDSYVIGYVIPCSFFFSWQDMLTVLVPLLLCCVVAHVTEANTKDPSTE